MSHELNQTTPHTVKAWGRYARPVYLLVAGLLLAQMQPPVSALGALPPSSYRLAMAWDASLSPETVGYRVYYGTTSGNYQNNIVLGNVTAITLSNLVRGITYYFAITAVGADGGESVFSNEASYRQELASGAQVQLRSAVGGGVALTVTGTSGQAYDIQATEDFVAWTLIGTVTLDAVGALEFTDLNAPGFTQRFYRTWEYP